MSQVGGKLEHPVKVDPLNKIVVGILLGLGSDPDLATVGVLSATCSVDFPPDIMLDISTDCVSEVHS